MKEEKGDTSQTVKFLQALRPSGPWCLVGIIPDGPTTTVTAHTADEIDEFVRQHNGKRNIYYSPNPLRSNIKKKASKTDVAAVEFLLGDLDPQDDETPEAAKSRYLKLIEDGRGPKPTMIIDSGNGLQLLWRLSEPIPLGEPVDDGEGRLVFGAVDEAVIADIEECSKKLMELLGAKAGTQNIDRILRLPGTTNLPSAVKRKRGRVQCEARLIEFNGATYPRDAFFQSDVVGDAVDADDHIEPDLDEDELWKTIKDGGQRRHGPSRSEDVFWVACEMLRWGYAQDKIVKVLLDRTNKISESIYEASDPRKYAQRQASQAAAKIDFDTDDQGVPRKSQTNIRIAMIKLDVGVRYDKFADRTLIDGLDSFGPYLEDAAVDRLWLTMGQRFRLHAAYELTYRVVRDAARRNEFHPVLDYLDNLKWDGTKRVDEWLVTYGGAKDTQYTRAVGALLLVAAVRRVRQPGCKFDEMPVLESPQGMVKSMTLQALAVKDEWFSDDLPFNIDSQKVIERLQGKWIVEAAELSGMRNSEIEHVKSFLSRTTDRARLAYGRIVAEVRRQCVIVGTTNSARYLKDTTGNRRFWPVSVKKFDLDALTRDRDQLWAEAAAREAAGESIRLDRHLWAEAAKAQSERLIEDPFVDALQEYLSGKEGKIASSSVREILGVRAGNLSQEHNRRMGDAMRRLGWKRRSVRIRGQLIKGYTKGEPPWKLVGAQREPDGQVTISVGEADPKDESASSPTQEEEGLFEASEGATGEGEDHAQDDDEIPF
jgi:predicted P-loop ATPase